MSDSAFSAFLETCTQSHFNQGVGRRVNWTPRELDSRAAAVPRWPDMRSLFPIVAAFVSLLALPSAGADMGMAVAQKWSSGKVVQ